MQHFTGRQLRSKNSPNTIAFPVILLVAFFFTSEFSPLKALSCVKDGDSASAYIADIQFESGDILKLSGRDEFLFAISDMQLIYIRPRYIRIFGSDLLELFSHSAHIHVVYCPSPFTKQKKARIYHRGQQSEEWYRKNGIYVASQLKGIVVPYNIHTCNSQHYVNYLKDGKLQNAEGCFLARDLKTNPPKERERLTKFYLEDVAKNKFYPNQAPHFRSKLRPSGGKPPLLKKGSTIESVYSPGSISRSSSFHPGSFSEQRSFYLRSPAKGGSSPKSHPFSKEVSSPKSRPLSISASSPKSESRH